MKRILISLLSPFVACALLVPLDVSAAVPCERIADMVALDMPWSALEEALASECGAARGSGECLLSRGVSPELTEKILGVAPKTSCLEREPGVTPNVDVAPELLETQGDAEALETEAVPEVPETEASRQEMDEDAAPEAEATPEAQPARPAPSKPSNADGVRKAGEVVGQLMENSVQAAARPGTLWVLVLNPQEVASSQPGLLGAMGKLANAAGVDVSPKVYDGIQERAVARFRTQRVDARVSHGLYNVTGSWYQFPAHGRPSAVSVAPGTYRLLRIDVANPLAVAQAEAGVKAGLAALVAGQMVRQKVMQQVAAYVQQALAEQGVRAVIRFDP